MDWREAFWEVKVWVAVIAVLIGLLAAYLGKRGDQRRIKKMGRQLSAILAKPNPSPLEEDVKRRLGALPVQERQALMTRTERILAGRAQEGDVDFVESVMVRVLTPLPEESRAAPRAAPGSFLAAQPVEVHGGPGLVLVRKARAPGFDVTTDGSSWLGGLPVLGGMGWPAGQDGRPMTPVAQIDLGELTEKLGLEGCPKTGSLAFFVAIEPHIQGAVRHVPARAKGETPPPAPLPAIEDGTFGGPIRKGEAGGLLVTHPRMAVDLVRVEGHARDAVMPELEAALGPLTLPDTGKVMNYMGQDRVLIWDSVQRFANAAVRAAEAAEALAVHWDQWAATSPSHREEGKAKAALIRAEAPPVLEEARDFAAQIAGRNPWAELSPAELVWVRRVEKTYQEGPQISAPALIMGWGTVGLGDLSRAVHETKWALAAASDADLAQAPEAWRAVLSAGLRLPSDILHRMFGKPENIQGAAGENNERYLLLQLAGDNVMGLNWGDAGVIQFWISPEDLRAGDFRRVRVTAEGH